MAQGQVPVKEETFKGVGGLNIFVRSWRPVAKARKLGRGRMSGWKRWRGKEVGLGDDAGSRGGSKSTSRNSRDGVSARDIFTR